MAAAPPPPSSFKAPVRRILQAAQVEVWKESDTFASLRGFLVAVGDSVRGKNRQDPRTVSEGVKRCVALLDELSGWVDEIPPLEQPQRFGNKAFRTWHARLQENADGLLKTLLPPELHPAVVELRGYLLISFGNETRIDYGTGHELNFAALLCCLTMTRFVVEADFPALCLDVFHSYLGLVRKLQRTYQLEPAGSHGVWGLDDFQFLPYYWGASQLIGTSDIAPGGIPDKATAAANADDYLLFGCVQYIFEVKTGPFHEHSRYLYDISAVKEWTKVHGGLLKMYTAEVMLKFPIIQHFVFGSLLPLDAQLPPAVGPGGGPSQYPGGVIPGSFPGTAGAGSAASLPPPVAAPSYGRARVAERGSLRPRPKPPTAAAAATEGS